MGIWRDDRGVEATFERGEVLLQGGGRSVGVSTRVGNRLIGTEERRDLVTQLDGMVTSAEGATVDVVARSRPIASTFVEGETEVDTVVLSLERSSVTGSELVLRAVGEGVTRSLTDDADRLV